MENRPNPKDRENPSSSSPNPTTTTSTQSTNSNPAAAVQPNPPPLTPKPNTPRSTDPNPFPTTFIQADTSSFKQVVQMLTGSAATAAKCATNPIPPSSKSPTGPKKPAFKLYERRSSLKNLKMISPLLPSGGSAVFSPRKQPEILSPSILDLPSLVLSPVTPLIPDPFNRPPHPNSIQARSAEDRAIAERGFYLHPSPRNAEPPRLLPLFPVTSPRAAASSTP